MFFKKKPVVIEAVYYEPRTQDKPALTFDEFPQWLGEAIMKGLIVPVVASDGYWHLDIETLEGSARVAPGDWIIRGVKGELYPCKPDIFEETYESAYEPEPEKA